MLGLGRGSGKLMSRFERRSVGTRLNSAFVVLRCYENGLILVGNMPPHPVLACSSPNISTRYIVGDNGEFLIDFIPEPENLVLVAENPFDNAQSYNLLRGTLLQNFKTDLNAFSGLFANNLSLAKQFVISLCNTRGLFDKVANDRNSYDSLRKLVSLMRRNDLMCFKIILHTIIYTFQHLKSSHWGRKVFIHCIKEEYGASTILREKVTRECLTLSADKDGCLLVNDVITNMPNFLSKLVLMDSITKHSFTLALHQYGNFVVQKLIQQDNDTALEVCRALEGNFAELAKDRYASRVVEKCLKSSAKEIPLLELLCDMLKLAEDPSGNYVVQRMLEAADPGLFGLMVDQLSEALGKLGSSQYGKKIAWKLTPILRDRQITNIVSGFMDEPSSSSSSLSVYSPY